MMGGASAFFGGGFGGPDFKFAVHRNRVAIDDFPMKMLGEGERERSLTTGGGTENDDQQRVVACRQRQLQ
jgi:hypothetical protein